MRWKYGLRCAWYICIPVWLEMGQTTSKGNIVDFSNSLFAAVIWTVSLSEVSTCTDCVQSFTGAIHCFKLTRILRTIEGHIMILKDTDCGLTSLNWQLLGNFGWLLSDKRVSVLCWGRFCSGLIGRCTWHNWISGGWADGFFVGAGGFFIWLSWPVCSSRELLEL